MQSCDSGQLQSFYKFPVQDIPSGMSFSVAYSPQVLMRNPELIFVDFSQLQHLNATIR